MFSKFSCCRTIDDVESFGSKEEAPIEPQKETESSDLPSKPESESSNSTTAVEKTEIKSKGSTMSKEALGTNLSFYLNFVILNASDIVKATVKKKLGPGLLGMVAGAAINADSKVSATIAEKLSTQIPVSDGVRL